LATRTRTGLYSGAMDGRRLRGWAAGLVVGVLVLAACGLEHKKKPPADPDDRADVSARDLDDINEEGSIWHSLDNSEKTAVERSGMSGVAHHAKPLDDEDEDAFEEATHESKETTSDKAGKVTMSFLLVAVTLGAAAAPFLLF
jgi:hypothetical protein